MSADEHSPEESHESPVDATLGSEGFRDTEDALKGADVKSGEGDSQAFDEQSADKVTGGATEPNPESEDAEGTP